VASRKARRPGGLRLWTFVSNERAQRFYERWGFEEVERTDGRDNEERSPGHPLRVVGSRHAGYSRRAAVTDARTTRESSADGVPLRT
jgi:ribosomal protein S18 acetylase RimI-like enzyme